MYWYSGVLDSDILLSCIVENLTHWSGGNIFVQNVGTHLLDYMSEPGCHIMNILCFESLISSTFTHTHCCSYLLLLLCMWLSYWQTDSINRDIKIYQVYREVWLIPPYVQKKYFLCIWSNCKGFGIICISCMYQ
jgi:hypothetical protein